MTTTPYDVRRELLQRMKKERGHAHAESGGIPRRAQTTPVPLSFAQQRLWFLDRLVPDNAFYTVDTLTAIHAAVDAAALEKAINAIVARHESLRTSFRESGGVPMQHIAPSAHVPLVVVDLRAMPADQREGEIRRRASVEARMPFDLTRGPLVRATLLRSEDAEYVLLLSLHHIIADGWSLGVLSRELRELYTAFASGRSPDLPALPVQYADFAVWQSQWLTGSVMAEQLTYWKRQLADLPPLALRTDKQRPPIPTFEGAFHSLQVSPATIARLRDVAASQQSTLFMVLLAAYQILLGRYCDQHDFAIGSPIANRTRKELEPLIGFFVNTLVLRANLDGDPPFTQLLARVREVTRVAYAHQDLPFEKVVEELQPERDLSRNPLFQVSFQLFNAPSADAAPASGMAFGELQRGTSKFDLRLDLWETQGGGAAGQLEYSKDLFFAETVALMGEHYVELLASIAADPARPISRLSMMSAKERATVVYDWNRTASAYPRDDVVPELFARSVATTPHAIALRTLDGQTMTYAELEARARHLASRLQHAGVAHGAVVGLYFDRCPDMVASMLAVLQCGAAYLPLSTAYPPERVRTMIEDAGAFSILAPAAIAATLNDVNARVLRLEEELDVPLPPFESVHVRAEDVAYVIYTSGSTGKPKGVLGSHRGIARLVLNTNYLQIHSHDVFAQISTAAFDAATLEIWGPLLNGASLVFIPKEVALAPDELARELRRAGVTTAFMTTPLFHQTVLQTPDAFGTMRTLMVGGSAADVRMFRKVVSTAPPGRFLHVYGPTENATYSTWYDIAALDDAAASIPIGKPIANSVAYVLDEQLEPVPIGVPGELFVGGDGLANGYLGQPEMTARKFVENPFVPGQRLYRTGDRARYLHTGDLDFLGRRDDQIKIRGFRVELGEIESVLAQHPAIAETAVAVREDVEGDQRLAAYVALNPRYFDTVDASNESGTIVQHWTETFNQVIYKEDERFEVDPTFNIAGWNSSYTNEPIPAEEMREQVETTVARILSFAPHRVLEIGCGTGLLLFRIAPHLEHYIGTDISDSALRYIDAHRHVLGDAAMRIELHRQPADDFSGIEHGSVDTVILNSVVQYFPSVEYLIRVLEGCTRVLAPGGVIFLGDLRSHPYVETLHASIELFRAPRAQTIDELRERIVRAVGQEHELLVDPELFTALHRWIPAVGAVQVQQKRGVADHELTRFRYDAVVQAGIPGATPLVPWHDWDDRWSVSTLRARLLAGAFEMMGIRGIPNARLAKDAATLRLIRSGQEFSDAGALDDAASSPIDAVHPESLWQLANETEYEVLVRWSARASAGTMDALFLRRGTTRALVPFGVEADASRPIQAYGNNPIAALFVRQLVPQLQHHLRARLPDYMVPGAFVLLDSLPLAPNGKVNRDALPAPDRSRPLLDISYAAPRTDIERKLAAIWSSVLNLERIGIHDNFFTELGGHSLLATQVMSRVRDEMGVDLPLRCIFETPTVGAFARTVGERAAAAVPLEPMLPIAKHEPLSPAECADALLRQMGEL